VRFCRAIGREEFAGMQHDAAQWPDMRASIERAMAARDVVEWLAIFERQDVQAAPVNDFHEAIGDLHFIERGTVMSLPQEDEPAVQIGNPVRLTGTATCVRHLGEVPGASTSTVLEEFGFTSGQIAAFFEAGAIGARYE
jgi:alpha-methylacyl-CoA racemase